MGSLDKANLARVRDNQRRSRARRREYVADLETRLKKFERQGAEATYAIQKVARRVADDNKKLRVLLNRLGYDNERIRTFLQAGSSNPTEAITPSLSQEQEDMIQTLELLLASHFPEGPDTYSATSLFSPCSSVYNSVESNVGSSAYGQGEGGTLDTAIRDCIQLQGALLSDTNVPDFEPQAHSQYPTSGVPVGNSDILCEPQHSLGVLGQSNNFQLTQAIQYGANLVYQDTLYDEHETHQRLGDDFLVCSPPASRELSYSISVGNVMPDPVYTCRGYSGHASAGQCLDNYE
ncbi:hypothetical protein F5Y13DRAFT_95308 [Hypoxylon sp. FL1857]|nr:hypothetical protein F5Y13DRAFT_95308 [Hypoxylon sp. FL1857]